MRKNQTRTVRFYAEEAARIDDYLSKNRIFDSFSSLARLATLQFIQKDAQVRLHGIPRKPYRTLPRFLAELKISEKEFIDVLQSPGFPIKKRKWIEKLLIDGTTEDVFTYLTLREIEDAMPAIHLPFTTRDRWKTAIFQWKKQSDAVYR